MALIAAEISTITPHRTKLPVGCKLQNKVPRVIMSYIEVERACSGRTSNDLHFLIMFYIILRAPALLTMCHPTSSNAVPPSSRVHIP